MQDLGPVELTQGAFSPMPPQPPARLSAYEIQRLDPAFPDVPGSTLLSNRAVKRPDD
jgi:hypothetical protein